MTLAPKPLNQFFIDNQGQWPNGAKLVGNMVVWPDSSRYPGLVPISIAQSKEFDGRVVVQSGNRTILMSFLPGAKDMDGIKAGLNNKDVEQYRIAVDSLVQAMLVWRSEKGARPDSDVNAVALLNWLARSNPKDAEIISIALDRVLSLPGVSPEAKEKMRELIDALQKGLEKTGE